MASTSITITVGGSERLAARLERVLQAGGTITLQFNEGEPRSSRARVTCPLEMVQSHGAEPEQPAPAAEQPAPAKGGGVSLVAWGEACARNEWPPARA